MDKSTQPPASKEQRSATTQSSLRVFHPATARPAMYTGERGDRTIEQWLIDALEAYRK